MFRFLLFIFISLTFSFSTSFAKNVSYDLVISQVKNSKQQKLLINGSMLAPLLEFTEGDDVTIKVKNNLKEATSVHFHGLIIPGDMDGVHGLNGYKEIKPKTEFTYHFKIRQSGAYWYHSHTKGQRQDGIYGPLIINPKKEAKSNKSDYDYYVVLSDKHSDSWQTILKNLNNDPTHYEEEIETDEAEDQGSSTKSKKDVANIVELAEVRGYNFLLNGKTNNNSWVGLFKKNKKVRLRFINASAMSYFDIRIPGLKMQVIEADGQPVKPVKVNEFRIGTAETYDVLVKPKDDKVYTIEAESIDREGFALGVLATKKNAKPHKPIAREKKPLYAWQTDIDKYLKATEKTNTPLKHISAWYDSNAPKNYKVLSYADLAYAGIQKDTRAPEKDIIMNLTMDDHKLGFYIEPHLGKGANSKEDNTLFYGSKASKKSNQMHMMDAIRIKKGSRVRLKFINKTPIQHTMHLHGMFMQLENGRSPEKMPNQHTIIIPPFESYSALLTASELGQWALHCHMLYHMLGGMMTKIEVYG